MSPFNLILFDDDFRESFLPLAWTRPVADFRIGIFTIREKWEKRLRTKSTTWTAPHLAQWKFPFQSSPSLQNLWINSRVVPNGELAFEVLSLNPGAALVKDDLLIACNAGRSTEPAIITGKDHLTGKFSVRETNVSCTILHRICDIFVHNGKAIVDDFELLRGTESEKLSDTNIIIGTQPVFVGKNVSAETCIFNTERGPVFIGNNALLMEGSLVRGPVAIGENAVLKMGAKIYGETTIGPGCKVGGEVMNCVLFGNSNKAHDGYLGNSVVGEWCNLGAGSNSSNLKNNYGDVEVWNYAEKGFENSGQQFHGLIMGDHAKCAIGTQFNTGSVIGVSANVFGNGFPPKFIPDFSWGGSEGLTDYRFEKAIETIERVYQRRSMSLSKPETEMLKAVLEKSASFRKAAFNG